MEYKRTEDAVFRLTFEERHHLLGKILKEYVDSMHRSHRVYGWCEGCGAKWIDSKISFWRCNLFDSCGRSICGMCIGRELHNYVCSYHRNITLRAMALRRLKYD